MEMYVGVFEIDIEHLMPHGGCLVGDLIGKQ